MNTAFARIPFPLSFIGFLVLGAATGSPARAGGLDQAGKVQPLTRAWLQGLRLPGLDWKHFGGLRLDKSGPAVVPVTVRLRSSADLAHLLRLESPDIRIVRTEGKVAGIGRFVSALVSKKGLDKLSGMDWVERIEPDRLPLHPRPLWITGAEVQAPYVWHSLDESGLPITGKGVTIGDIDSGIDIFHPLFFRADGGYFAWLDVNNNGVFDPGTDAVDLNGNGQADQGETLRLIDAEAFTLWDPSHPILDTDNGTYEAGWDYLYADLDGNGTRDFGAAAGFGEQDPSYGEPLFLADDVNGNGVLDPNEKLVALKTSKIAAVNDQGTVYRRGENLIEVGDMAAPFHGTGASGVLVAGTPGLTRVVGIAPDADLVLGVAAQQEALAPGQTFTWMVQSGAQVVLHEYAPWTGLHMDGSTNFEGMMDTAAGRGVAQANPTGNLGGSQKACVVQMAPSAATDLDILVPQGWGISYVNSTFHWMDPTREFTFILHTPTGEDVDLAGTGQGITLQDGTTMVYAYQDTSPRSSVMIDIYIWGQTGQQLAPITAGTWTLTITDVTNPPAADPIEMDGFVMDEVSGWGQGARFLENVSEQHLIGFPATADSAISVAAYTGRDDYPFNQGGSEVAGQLRRYSCRGTRIDGVHVMDIAAPDNPLSLASRLDYSGTQTMPLGALAEFGGTSGASPHVAGAAALIKQAHPDWTGLDVRDAIRAGALVDGAVHGDDVLAVEDLWGAGKLRIYNALYGADPMADDPPTIQIPEAEVAVAQNITLPVTLSDNEDQISDLQLYWDLDYDGRYDLGPVPGDQPLATAYSDVGVYVSKVQVVDSAGNSAAALAVVHVTETGPDAGVGADGGLDGGLDGGEPGNGGDGGCNCRTGSQSGQGARWPLFLLFAALWMILKRRRTNR